MQDNTERTRVTDQILWENRKTYIELFEKYLRGEIDAEEVLDNFFPLFGHHQTQSGLLWLNPEEVKKIKIDSKSEGFSDLMYSIFNTCEPLDVEEMDDTSCYPVSENRFRKEISLRLQELKDYD
jgi:hypothetical protein